MGRARWVNNQKPGDYLIVDEQMGTAHFASETQRDWDGLRRLSTDLDGKHPDFEYHPYPIEEFPDDVVPQTFDEPYVSAFSATIGGTSVPRPVDGPADNLNSGG